MRQSCSITWRAVGVSPPSCPHLTRRAYAAPLAGFAATGDVTPLIVNPAMMPFNLCIGAYLHSLSLSISSTKPWRLSSSVILAIYFASGRLINMRSFARSLTIFFANTSCSLKRAIRISPSVARLRS